MKLLKTSATLAHAPLLALLLAAPLGACTDKQEQAAGPEEEVLPNIQVELPGSPDFDEARAPVRYEDETYSIFGLRKDIDENLKRGESGEEVIVKGWVQEIYVPPECPEGELCPPGKQPHFWITDKADSKGKKRAMMVVNYYFPIPEWDEDTQKLWEEEPLVVVELGKEYTIKGKFKRFSDSGFAHDNGLLEFVSYKVTDPESGEETWISPPNSSWHPKTVAMEEEQNREMQDRMREEAEKLKKKKGD
ncbi:hypothetical protein G6O69_26945 [Pseudenhygromyxa sp. WMMC2535]|uniref:hypothetical protein n=1 Tax=Pseudenhygromyxa sp. WMMC2535 TaxID=2712867 RepID=UPI0015550024|nr:hypothetical protein [Pseudenhygromyxa sp. WMMC2535]NVB41505.1 hypothetical protein [Pseudenhygromyxa sp. WMMC2535]